MSILCRELAMKFKFEIKEIPSIRLLSAMSCLLRFAWNWHMRGREWWQMDASQDVGYTRTHHALNYLWRLFWLSFYFSVLQFKKKKEEENIRVYRNHCIDWLLMYRCTELLKLNSGCVLHEIWAVSDEEKRREGASSIGGRINKGRVVINSVRHVAERERELVVDSRGGLLIFSILLFRLCLSSWNVSSNSSSSCYNGPGPKHKNKSKS